MTDSENAEFFVDRDEIVRQQTEFLSKLESLVKLQEMRPYEVLVSRLLKNEPLRLGPLGTALTDRYQPSLTGQLALTEFYRYLDQHTDTAHDAWVSAIVSYMGYERSGDRDSPYRLVRSTDGLKNIHS